MSNQSTTSCPHGELAVAWALHSLEPAEEALVLAHLPDCSDCIRIAAETEEVGAMLGMAVPESVPSTTLEQRVLAVTTTPQVAAEEDPAEPQAPQTPAPQTPATQTPATQTPAPQTQEPEQTPPQNPVPETPEPFTPAPRTEPPNVAGPWPGPEISRPRRAPRGRSRWDPRCLVEPAIMLFIVLVACAIAAAVVFYGI